MKKNTPRSRSKRPTATLNLKATEVKKDASSTAQEKTTSSGGTTPPASASKTVRSGATSAASKTTASKTTAKPGFTRSGKAGADKATDSKVPPSGTPPKAPNSTAASGGGFFSHLVASLLGAVLGIFGLSYASNQNMLPPSLQLGGNASEQYERLSGKIGSLESMTISSDVNSMANRLTHLNDRLDKTEATLGGGKQGNPTLAQKVARLETVLSNLEKAAKTGKGGKLAGLTAVTQQLASSTKRALALNTELIKLREAQTTFREDLTSIRSSQADFRTASATISNELAKLRNNAAEITANASRPPDVSKQINPVLNTLSKLTSKIDGLLNREAGSKAEGRDIALALSLGELKRAVNDGSPYEAELARVQPHAPQSLDLSVLLQHASKGIITHSALRSTFADSSRKALASEHTATSGSFLDQIVANAKSMVQVRPTGLVKGETTGAVLSRMEYKLARDDLRGALKESSTLQGTAKDVMQPWLDKASSRVNSDSVLRSLEDKIRNSLAGSNSKVKG